MIDHKDVKPGWYWARPTRSGFMHNEPSPVEVRMMMNQKLAVVSPPEGYRASSHIESYQFLNRIEEPEDRQSYFDAVNEEDEYC